MFSLKEINFSLLQYCYDCCMKMAEQQAQLISHQLHMDSTVTMDTGVLLLVKGLRKHTVGMALPYLLEVRVTYTSSLTGSVVAHSFMLNWNHKLFFKNCIIKSLKITIHSIIDLELFQTSVS